MKINKTIEAKFISRPNRFVANVKIGDEVFAVHVKNTGRCKELLYEGVRVILFDSENENRKYRYDLIAVWKEKLGWVNIDSQAPNQVVKEWLSQDNEIFKGLTYIKPEYTYGDSRVDFYMEDGNRKILMEVKGCTLERDGEGFFPDAPTERGVKHLRELIKAKEEGYDSYLAFVVAMPDVNMVYPNSETDPNFAEAIYEAIESGVKVINLLCDVGPDYLTVKKAEISTINPPVPTVLLITGAGEDSSTEIIDKKIRRECLSEYKLVEYHVDNWDRYLTPWPAKGIFCNRDFEGEGKKLLKKIEANIKDTEGPLYIAGYSLGGLFALWSLYESKSFDGAVCCSGSLWYPGWDEFVNKNRILKKPVIYMSLGEKEIKTKNPIMKSIKERTEKQIDLFSKSKSVRKYQFEWNPGGHFDDYEDRMTKGIKWILESRF